jgi:hypothetical protein
MDQWLAQVYGTGSQDTTVDLEKVAQAAILEKLAAEGGYDLSGLTEEQAIELANELMAGGQVEQQAQGQEQQEQTEPAQEEVEEQLAKEAQAKFEEADFLGRVMAHAYTQEMSKIALEAGQEGPSKTVRGEVGRAAGKVGGAIKGVAGRAGELLAGGKKMMDPSHPGGATVRAGNKALVKNIVAGGAGRGEALKSLGARGGALLAAGAAAKGIHSLATRKSEKTKEASVFEKLAEERAAEVLQANGINPETGEPMEQQNQQQQQDPNQQQEQQAASPDEQFQAAVDARAAEILAEHGYSME